MRHASSTPDPLRRRLLLTALSVPLASAGLAGCAEIVPGQRPPPRFFRLTPKSTFEAELPRVDWQLVVERPLANAGLDTTRVALMRTPQEFEYYARANWTDSAPRMVQTLLVESFENSGRIVSIGRESLALRSDFVLKTELREFQAEYFHGPIPRVRVGLSAKLVKMPQREIVASKSHMAVAEAEADEISAVVTAFDSALGAVLKDAVAWTLRTGETLRREVRAAR